MIGQKGQHHFQDTLIEWRRGVVIEIDRIVRCVQNSLAQVPFDDTECAAVLAYTQPMSSRKFCVLDATIEPVSDSGNVRSVSARS